MKKLKHLLMKNLKYLIIFIAIISNVLLSYKLSIIIINKKPIISTKLDGLGLDLIHDILEDDTITNPFTAISKKTKLSLQDVIGNYSKIMITMDFSRQEDYLTYLSELQSIESNNDLIFTNLDFSSNSLVTIPDDKAPQQGGYNVIPIKDFSGKSSITVNLKGIKNKK